MQVSTENTYASVTLSNFGGNQVGSDGQDDVLIIKMTLAFVEYSLCTGQCAH